MCKLYFKNEKFPDSLKKATITPVYKKDDPTDKVNYRPVSVLSLISKIFEKIIHNQLREYMDLFLNKLLYDLEKHILLNTLYLNYYIVGKKSLITRVLLAQSSWTSIKHMTAYHMTLLLQSLKLMV